MVQKTEDFPRHVGIIMDGNGRWAKKRRLPRTMGHKRGADAFSAIARHVNKLGLEYLTVYAFSTENWKRPPEEVTAIMNLLRDFLKNAEQYSKENMRLIVFGDQAPLDDDLRGRIDEVKEKSKNNTGTTVNIALNYGGRDEILHAARRLAALAQSGFLTAPEQIDEELFSANLYSAGQPDVDLVIRTSGEQRISNFLLWQSAYAEYYFTEVLWPDFKPKHFDQAVKAYTQRSRRMGGI